MSKRCPVFEENRIVGLLEAGIMRNQNRNLHIALEEKNFIWGRNEVKVFMLLYVSGQSLKEIAEYFERPPVEVMLLAFDLVDKNKIEIRKGWALW